MTRLDNSHAADITAVLGATGSGKTLWVRQKWLRPMPRRLVLWDFKREFEDIATPIESTAEFVRAVRASSFRVAFRPSMDTALRQSQFDIVCRALYAVGRASFVVEEVHLVTQPGRAPGAWAMMTTTGRALGLRIAACSQRPALVDKTFLANCSTIHVGRASHPPDVKALAQTLGIGVKEVDDLGDLEFIERDTRAKKISRGKVKLPESLKAKR